MSYLTRVPRALVQIRGYADKSAMEQAGDALKKVGQAFKVSRASPSITPHCTPIYMLCRPLHLSVIG